MDERNFRLWMETTKDFQTARTYTSRCIRVEQELMVDLDEQFAINQGNDLLGLLKYTKREKREGLAPKCGICFKDNSNAYSGMNALRASVKKYFEYKKTL